MLKPLVASFIITATLSVSAFNGSAHAQAPSNIKGRIRAANSVLNEERIVARLRGIEKVGVELALRLGDQYEKVPEKPGGLNRRVVVDEDRHCAVCHKRFGGSAIRVWPDGSVVHSGCMRGSVGKGGSVERPRAW